MKSEPFAGRIYYNTAKLGKSLLASLIPMESVDATRALFTLPESLGSYRLACSLPDVGCYIDSVSLSVF